VSNRMACTHPQTVPAENFRLVPRSVIESWKLLWSASCSLFKCFMIISCILVFHNTYRFISYEIFPDPQTLHGILQAIHKLSTILNDFFQDFPIKRVSCTNFTLDRISKDKSMGLDRNPFSPPHETFSTFNTSACAGEYQTSQIGSALS